MKTEAHVWVVEYAAVGSEVWHQLSVHFVRAEAEHTKKAYSVDSDKYRISKYTPPPCGSEGKP